MDFGSASRPAPISGVPLVPRADIVSTTGSVGVELPPEKTVQSVKAGEAVRVDIRSQPGEDQAAQSQQRRAAERQSEQPRPQPVERRLTIDPRTRSVVVQKRDADTGETIELVPDETTLKLRAYARQLIERALPDGEAPRAVERIA